MKLEDKIVFLGTAGARIAVFKQIRASGGIWITLEGVNLLIDPGPGCLVRCVQSRVRLDPTKLDAIILTHEHLDHSADVNVMIEAMTEGGFKKRGILFAPRTALEDEPVVFKYVRDYVEEIIVLKEHGVYPLRGIKINTPVKHKHGKETYGLNIISDKLTISYITDTKFFPELLKHYKGHILIINVVRRYETKELEHMSLEEAKEIIRVNQPELAILTHFGMTMLRANPQRLAEEVSKETGVKVIAAKDGMAIDLNEYKKERRV